MSAFGIDWFGLVIPGRPILVNFEMVDPTKCAATIERPGEVAEICFFLTPSGAQLPPDKCAVLYLSLDGAAWTPSSEHEDTSRETTRASHRSRENERTASQ